MAGGGKGFRQFKNFTDPANIKDLNDMLRLMYKKLYGGITSEDFKDFVVSMNDIHGGDLVIGNTYNGSIIIKTAGGTTIGQITKDGIWVNGSNLILKHPYGGQDMYPYEGRNFCLDHSFEMVSHDAAEDGTHHDFAFVNPPSSGVHQWEIDAGNPKVFDDYGASYTNRVYAAFGGQCVAVNSANSLMYTCPIDGSRSDYTVSVHAWPHPTRGTSTMRAMIGVQYLNGAGAAIGAETLTQVTLMTGWTALSGDGRIQNIYRIQSYVNRPSGGQYIRVRLLSPSPSEWICYDGVQITPHNKMCIYTPEDGAFRYLRQGV